ncbi:hypothetical protein [Nocardioides sp. LS1]|uniref:hypothetical protein n=1 Tax=Nocardioides sp. LS1 TaxID=1027620 RepID=UPI000FFAF383|nr:hypothetical protein [Nocardioides sp. LS1]GCD90175.1 hypothetical protein NLS1_21810 [Nocardioides sp. LS1]
MAVDPAYADQTAGILVTLLRDVFGVVHPAFLVDRVREDLTTMVGDGQRLGSSIGP